MRPEIDAIDRKHETSPTMTIRQAVEWWKDMMNSGSVLTGEEIDYVNRRWGYMMNLIAEREGVPAGALSYFTSELAYRELKLLETALMEAKIAEWESEGGSE
jgi:hypothetical protein